MALTLVAQGVSFRAGKNDIATLEYAANALAGFVVW